MQAIREITTVTDHKIIFTLPDGFNYNKVELIILPIEEKQNLSDFLLTLPTFTTEEINNIETAKKDLNKWEIKEF